ncbi:MAG TPA: ATP cone domain-containing protein, partial [Acidovorax sp.]|nr:ATP cone domain-containing protein [Acidovorax sp.]
MNTNDSIRPGEINVIKRNGTVVAYDESRIATAIKKAFLDPNVLGQQGLKSASVVEKASAMAASITETFHRRMPSGGHVHIEEIQDQVELTLMRAGEHAVAREYVIYRNEHAKLRRAAAEMAQSRPTINVTAADGSVHPLNIDAISATVQQACEGIADVEPTKIIKGTLDNVYDGIKEQDLKHALI